MKQVINVERIEGRGITLEQLRAFVFIAQCGSFGHAGEALGRTQSTLSAGLRRLESDIGCRLIERRQGHILGLTEEGRQLLPAALDILTRTSRAIGALNKHSLTGQIRLGVPDDFEIKKLHDIIGHCLAENPGLRVIITAASSPVLTSMAEQQLLDVVITKGIAGQVLTPGLDRLLRVETLHWVSAGALDFTTHEDIPLVTFPQGCVVRHCAVTALEQAGRQYYFSYVSGAFSNIHSATVAGLGISLLPLSAISDDLYILTPEKGAPGVPAIQLVLRVTRPGALCQQFAGYIDRGLMR